MNRMVSDRILEHRIAEEIFGSMEQMGTDK